MKTTTQLGIEVACLLARSDRTLIDIRNLSDEIDDAREDCWDNPMLRRRSVELDTLSHVLNVAYGYIEQKAKDLDVRIENEARDSLHPIHRRRTQ